MHITLRLIFILLVLPAFWGCAGSVGPRSANWDVSEVDMVWPDPPEVARIKFLREVASTHTSDKKNDNSGKWLGWLTGEDEQQMPLLAPYAVVADGQGRVWVADTQGKSVVSFDLSRQQVNRQGVFSGVMLQSPVGLALDVPRERLYISDSQLNQILVCDLSGRLITILDHETMERPAGMATDVTGNLYVADVSLGEVLKFSPDQKLLKRFGSHLTPGGKFNRAANVAIGEDGTLYVVDSLNFQVEMISATGESLGRIGQIGDVPGSFARPRGVALDSDGHVYVADAAFGNVQIFNQEGQLLLFLVSQARNSGSFLCLPGFFLTLRIACMLSILITIVFRCFSTYRKKQLNNGWHCHCRIL